MWMYKTYFLNGREYFSYDRMGMTGAAGTQKDFLYLESLLQFLEMDHTEWEPQLQQAAENLEQFLKTRDVNCSTAVQMALGELAGQHMYFQLPYLKWSELLTRSTVLGEDIPLPTDELRQLPEQLTQMQKEVQAFFDQVLDIDQAGRDVQRNVVGQTAFRFQPISVSYERVCAEIYAEVLYPNHILDLIDFALCTCVQQRILVRKCKNCGRYFALTGRVSAEYCERPRSTTTILCRDTGAFHQWNKGKEDDLVFKEYRREYKRRFAWIKAGRVTAEEFYLWSEQAREKKRECDSGQITLEEYAAWLKQS